MRALLCLLSLTALTAAAPDRAPIDTLAPDAETRWVPFELTPAKQIRFAMTVAGRPVVALLDTGVSVSLLSRDYADRMKLRVRPGPAAIAIGGPVESGWVELPAIAVGSLVRRKARIAVATLPDAASDGTPVDLLVGRDLTQLYALDIDYAARRFRLIPSGRLPFRGSSAPLRIAGTWPSYVTEISIGAARVSRVSVDTGDGGAITLRRQIWKFMSDGSAPITSTIAYGIGGPSVADLTIVRTVQSGTLVAHNVEVRIEPDTGYTQAIGMNGRIGSGFLAGYRVLLDPTAGRMVLSPGKGADAPPLKSTSGLLLRAEPDRLTVLHVMRGGPAEAGGWHSGEQICSVDGVAVDRTAALHWPVGEPGRTVRLGLCNGEARTLTLRTFY